MKLPLWRKIGSAVLNDSFDTQHKLLNIMLSITIVMGTASVLISFAVSFRNIGNLFALIMVLFTALTLWISVKKQDRRLAVLLISLIGSPVLLSAMFITNGGTKSGMHLWYILGLLVPLISLNGRKAAGLFLLDLSSAVACIMLEIYKPHIIIYPDDPRAVSSDLIVSFTFFALIIGFMFKYQTAEYDCQKEHLIEQDRELVTAMQAAQSASTAKSSFLAHMSHEIRTPINAILGMEEMIIRESIDKDITSYAMNIRSAGNSLLTIINDILDFSKIESDKMDIYPAAYNLSVLLKDCYNLVFMRAADKDLKFSFEVDSDTPKSLVGDEFRIRQVVTNLLTNAIKYTPKGSVTMNVGFKRIEDNRIMLTFSVKDTGIGISEEDMQKLFDSFRRINTEQTHSIEGTGLGLTIAKRLVDLMEGTINVESEYGKGSTFTVNIPQQIGGRSVIGSFSPDNTYIPEKKYRERFHAPDARILVVDDVKINVDVIRELIKKTLIHSDSAFSGAECLELASRERYDIIFMDHLMPEMDGVETLNRMKELKNNPNKDTPVIALTANAMVGAREEYIDLGFSDYLSKPVKGADLEDMLLKFLPANKVHSHSEASSDKDKLMHDDTGGLEFLNTRAGISFCCGDITFYKDVLKSLAHGDIFERLGKCFAAEDWKNYRVCIHSIMGTALYVGAEELCAKTAAISDALKNDNISYVKEHHKGYISSCERLCEKLSEYFGEEAR